MLIETGIVIAVDKDRVWVETQTKTSCSSCQVNKTCGTGIVSKTFSRKFFLTPLKNHLNANINDTVEVGIPEDLIIKASFMLYLLPLACMMICLIIGQALFSDSNEVFSIISALIGLLLGFFITHKYDKKSSQNNELSPVLLRVVKKPISVKQIETSS